VNVADDEVAAGEVAGKTRYRLHVARLTPLREACIRLRAGCTNDSSAG
jgi:hypothetical protein